MGFGTRVLQNGVGGRERPRGGVGPGPQACWSLPRPGIHHPASGVHDLGAEVRWSRLREPGPGAFCLFSPWSPPAPAPVHCGSVLITAAAEGWHCRPQFQYPDGEAEVKAKGRERSAHRKQWPDNVRGRLLLWAAGASSSRSVGLMTLSLCP